MYKYFYKKDVEVFGLFLGQNINQLISEIESHKYEPQPVCRYYIPKKNYLTRPISLLNFIDLLVYQAIANVLMNEFAEGFAIDDNRRVFANIINKEESSKYFQFSNWKNQWKCYRQKIEKIYKEGFTWVADFDIASFYDLIDQEILLNLLKSFYIKILRSDGWEFLRSPRLMPNERAVKSVFGVVDRAF